MPKFRVGSIVRLNSGCIVKVVAVSPDKPLEADIIYTVEVDNKKELVNGSEVVAETTLHYWNRQQRGLTSYESDVLDMYTGPTFRAWNKCLRDGNPPTTEIEALQRVLGKAPNFTGNVYRALSFKSKEEVQSYGSKFIGHAEYKTPQFMSTSRNAAAVNAFKGDVFGAFMSIYTNGLEGATLREFTGTDDLGENEVLFRYGVEFTIVADSAALTMDGAQFQVKLNLKGAIPPPQKFVIPEFKRPPKKDSGDGKQDQPQNKTSGSAKSLRLSQ